MDKPTLLTADANQELIDTVALWETMAGKTLVKGQPDYLLCAILAYQKYLLLQRVNSAFCNMLLDFSTAPALDYLVALLGVARSPAQPATCSLSFVLIEGHGVLTISAGTRVASSDGLAVFEVDEDVVVEIGANTATASATCQTDGIIGNAYEIGAVNTIMDVQPFISTCSNLNITANGADDESDEELRIRAKLAPATFSTAGPKDAYAYFAKSVSSSIIDVAVMTSQEDGSVPPGEVDIYALIENGQESSPELNELILQTLSDEKIRPLTDTVVVSSPSKVIYDISVGVTKYKYFTGLSSELISAITAILVNYRVEKYSKLGLDVIASEIEKICRIDGVYDLAITIAPPIGKSLTGRNLVISPNEFPYLDMITVNVTGSNNG